ncbi:Trypsin [Popillia japonica]|uniref:Trypsin n=1 Tax=Popillia japonica TaxID=7064 RepID=A0AAW1JZV6_POPJA
MTKFSAWILLIVLHFQYVPELQAKPYNTFIINVCHLRLGHRCLGCYIRQSWVLTLYECAWTAKQFKHVRLLAGNPTLDCYGGQYRSAVAVYLHPKTSLSSQRTGLIRLDEPFRMERGVSMVNVGKPSSPYDTCTIYKFSEDNIQEQELYAIPVYRTATENCDSLFNYSYFISKELMACAFSEKKLSFMETVKFAGISPVICYGRLRGFVIAANGTTVGVLSTYYDAEWIDSIIRSNKYRITQNSASITKTSHSKLCGFIIVCSLIKKLTN